MRCITPLVWRTSLTGPSTAEGRATGRFPASRRIPLHSPAGLPISASSNFGLMAQPRAR